MPKLARLAFAVVITSAFAASAEVGCSSFTSADPGLTDGGGTDDSAVSLDAGALPDAPVLGDAGRDAAASIDASVPDDCVGNGILLCDSFERSDPFEGSEWSVPFQLGGTLDTAGQPAFRGRSLAARLMQGGSDKSAAALLYQINSMLNAASVRVRFWLYVPGNASQPTKRVGVATVTLDRTTAPAFVSLDYNPASAALAFSDGAQLTSAAVALSTDAWYHVDLSVTTTADSAAASVTALPKGGTGAPTLFTSVQKTMGPTGVVVGIAAEGTAASNAPQVLIDDVVITSP